MNSIVDIISSLLLFTSAVTPAPIQCPSGYIAVRDSEPKLVHVRHAIYVAAPESYSCQPLIYPTPSNTQDR